MELPAQGAGPVGRNGNVRKVQGQEGGLRLHQEPRDFQAAPRGALERKVRKGKENPVVREGRRAHPPHVEKRLVEFINRKEYAKALHSALAATTDAKTVISRGHKIADGMKLPIVLDESVEKISKTKLILVALKAIGIGSDLQRSRVVKRRTGVGARKGGAKRARSLLVVVGKDCPLSHSAKNIAGVDVIEAGKIRVLDLAPGAKAGRLTAYTKGALEALAHPKNE
jgi:large subunit ribosomal protein L4e